MVTRSSGYVLAGVTGILLVLSFPQIGHPVFGWVALVPLLLAVGGQSSGRAFSLGLISGAVYFIGTLYWITRVMVVYGGLNIISAILVNGALIAYLALFPALFAVVMSQLQRAGDARMLMAAPFVWAATELGRTQIMGGFPWVLLGYSQVTVLPIAQLASVFGVYGVSALLAAVSAALAVLVAGGRLGRARVLPLAVMAVLVAGIALWGSFRVARGELTRAGTPIRVALVQGNVDQAEKWDARRATEIFRSYLQMTTQAIRQGVDLVVWPESSTPFYFEDDAAGAEHVRDLEKRTNVPILMGSDQIEHGRGETKYFNSAFLVRPDGTTAGVYRKMHLVPFGEYVPFKRLLFFAAPLVEAVSDFSAGESVVLLPLDGHSISTAICYDVVYPQLVRAVVKGGSELVTTITNDAWFGRTSAPYQHFAQASMRAIETGRYLVRSANTGISGIVDPYGRVLERTPIYEPVVVVGEARFLQTTTIY